MKTEVIQEGETNLSTSRDRRLIRVYEQNAVHFGRFAIMKTDLENVIRNL